MVFCIRSAGTVQLGTGSASLTSSIPHGLDRAARDFSIARLGHCNESQFPVDQRERSLRRKQRGKKRPRRFFGRSGARAAGDGIKLMDTKRKFIGKGRKAGHGKKKLTKNKDPGLPKRVIRKNENSRPKYKSKKAEKGGKKPDKTGGKHWKSKQLSGKLSRKRKLQDDTEGSQPKKPKWDNIKKKKKELKQNRQLNDKANYDIVIKGKQIWETLRRKNCEKEKRKKLLSDLQELIHGKIKNMAFAHDSTRVIQCYIQFGTEEQRQEVFEELKESFTELSKSKYSRNIVKKLLMYG